MTNTFKRRIYRLCLISATCFFAAFFLYDLGDIGIATEQLYLPCYVILFIGILFAFKALDTWSSWNEDNSEDTDVVEQNRRNAYPITFYIEATLVFLTILFLLVFTLIRSQPNIEESIVLSLAVLVAGGCICMGRLSSGLE